jgi:hypothetical protein
MAAGVAMGVGKGRRAWRLGLALCVASAMGVGACTGDIGGGGGTAPPTGPDDPIEQGVASLITTRFPRLSHAQWENTVMHLLRLDAVPGLSSAFSGDPLGGVFDNNEEVLLVTPNLWGDYQTAAEALATLVTDDPARLAAIMPADLPGDPESAARAFISDFGRRAYRRPLTQEEIDTYYELFTRGPELLEGGDDFNRGVRLTLQAFLQSPHFLYRVERSTEVGEDGLVHLDGWEVASKLSYMLWNTMPDDLLFGAAESGELSTPNGIMTQAARMLDDERSHAMVAAFHAQLYQYDHYEDLYKDPAYFPDFSSEIGADLQTEAELFIEDVVYSGGGLRELLTSPFTYVNSDLAAIYGLPGSFGADFERVELDPAERAGFLTRIGFLASNATPREQNTIHRGIFVNLRVLCNDIPSPPDNVPPLPPADDYATNRERVESHTGLGTCGATCHHGLINPPGYALEHYDAVGAFQGDEDGAAIDSSAEYTLDGAAVAFDGAIELSELIAESDQAHACYARYWLQYGYGRKHQDGDALTLEDLAAASKNGSAKDLILALTQTLAFRTRAVATEAP